jgi:hypothetical protein
MGPVRRGLILATLPAPAWAAVCDTHRPDWDGVQVTALGEAIALLTSPAGLIVIAITVVALRFRSQWIGLGAIVSWTVFITILTMADPEGARALAMEEGCVGQPTLLIGAAAAICVATAIYTMPRIGGE